MPFRERLNKIRRRIGFQNLLTRAGGVSSLTRAKASTNQEDQVTPRPEPLDLQAEPEHQGISSLGEVPEVPQASVVVDWVNLKSLSNILDQSTSNFAPVKAVVNELVGFIEVYQQAANNRNEFGALQMVLESHIADLKHHLLGDNPPEMSASMENLCMSILKELRSLAERQARGTARRLLGAGDEFGDVLICYQRIQGHLQRLVLNSNLSMWKILNDQAADSRLDRLGPSLAACYNSAQAVELDRGPCTLGTRVDVLGRMRAWVHDYIGGSVYWMNGMAGTGKTTLAYSACEELDSTHLLGASFFCSRLIPDCRDVNLIVPSLAYQLANFSRPFRCALLRVLGRERNVHTQLPRIQFESLIVKPLVEVGNTLPDKLVVVIDALDECDNKQSTRQIIEALLTRTMDLPIKFLITSRPEPEIRDQMKKPGDCDWISRLVLHELDHRAVQADIKTYLRAALGQLNPVESDLEVLVQRAGILFIYAATVARYVGHDNFSKNPQRRLLNVLTATSEHENNPFKDIDELYNLVLAAALDDTALDEEDRGDTKQVLYTIICAREPLTVSALSGLLGLNDCQRVRAALRPLWSVLHVVESNELVTTLHVSFSEYMFDSRRSKKFWCDPNAQQTVLTQCCFSCIRDTRPQFNICGLESSYTPDEKVLDLDTKIYNGISPHLLYACKYWATHLQQVKSAPELVEGLGRFVAMQLLLWMEVMNLTKQMNKGVLMIRQAEEWCRLQDCSQELIQLTEDAWKFTAAFTSNPVSRSTCHIYISMLPFWPASSPIGKHYLSRTRQMVEPQGIALSRRRFVLIAKWPAGNVVDCVIWSPDSTRVALIIRGQIQIRDSQTGQLVTNLGGFNKTTSIAFSPNGTRIACGSRDKNVYIWEIQNRRIVLGPFEGHTELVTSISFSPDGSRVATGSVDKTIRVWDAKSGRAILAPLKGHENSVTSVAFSHNGAYIVSGSWDRTLRLWDARRGSPVFDPFRGHTNHVTSVAFSPDGTHIASGSADSSVRIWDIRSSKKGLGVLRGHTKPVTSVAISPDGGRIVSGSADKTIRIWDVATGRTVLGPLGGHTNHITSVVFSPDGTRIVSGSRDMTILMWNARSQETKFDSLTQHASAIRSALFSPDGSQIFSASGDSSIRVLDLQTGATVTGPFKGHSSSVVSVALSHHGNQIAYACGDPNNSVRLWHTRHGEATLDLLQGHTNLVTSVAFSPDGTYVVSGSTDETLIVWDTQSKRQKYGPLSDHTDSVMCVSFSFDGAWIASGSRDKTIRMWDAHKGEIVLNPFEGHTNSVVSVAFSPDGTRIASGSWDHTVRLWNTRNAQMVSTPLLGHANSVVSVAFSQDGNFIVSGSWDRTIRIWDAQQGSTVYGPLVGHTDRVTSVAFSPDGTRVVSGSDDKSIRMWDTRHKRGTDIPLYAARSTQPSWKLNPDGWVVDSETGSNLLVWVPLDLHHVVASSGPCLWNTLEESVRLFFYNARIGESWIECLGDPDV